MFLVEIHILLCIKIELYELKFVRWSSIFEWVDEISNRVFCDFDSYDRKSRVSIFEKIQFEFSFRIRHRAERANK